jgi:hypothetical protein
MFFDEYDWMLCIPAVTAEKQTSRIMAIAN